MRPRHNRTGSGTRPATPTSERSAIKPVDFAFQAPEAQSVLLAGSFNNWDPKRTPLRQEGNGWKTTLWLGAGRHEYRFVVDGQWVSDPNARETISNGFGEFNSVVVV